MQRLATFIVVAALVGAAGIAGGSRHAGGGGGARLTAPLCGTSSRAPARYAHVVWIWLENHSYTQIVGPRGSAASDTSPFVNGTLAARCGLAANYRAVSHPSLPNYVAATSGSTHGLTTDCAPTDCALDGPSIFEQARSWRSYQESMPGNCSLSNTSTYAAKHNPATYYTRLRGACRRYDVPLGTTTDGALARDLARNTLPAFALVSPNLCNDTHDCPIATGDAWLRTWIPRIAASAPYRAGGTVVFVTWDEGAGSAGTSCAASANDESCHVATIVISPTTPPGTVSGTLFDHYSLLKTTEQLLGIRTYLGGAGDPSTASMRRAFHL